MKTGKLVLFSIALSLFHSTAMARLNVFACEPEWASLVTEIAGDNARVYSATTAMQDPHRIQARPSLIAKMRRADMVVCSGADLEVGWLPLLLRSSANSKVQPGQPGYIEVSLLVDRLEIPQQLDRSMGDVHAAGNPHVQMDPRRITEIARQLGERLATLDAANAKDYESRTQSFLQRWQQKLTEWQKMVAPLMGVKVVVHHKAWVYLFDWIGMEEVAALEPKPGVPPSAGHLAKIKQQMKMAPAKMVIRAAYQDANASNWLQQHAGVKAVELPFTVGGSEKASDLFGLIDDTVQRLLEGAR